MVEENLLCFKDLNGVLRACEKRPISLTEIEALVDSVEKEVRSSLEVEIPCERIGELVMEKLKELDEIAYVRFASVYRQFKDVNTFIEELEQLLGGNK